MISLEEIDQVIQSGPLNPPGRNIKSSSRLASDAKFGMFTHSGRLASVPKLVRMVFAKYVYQGNYHREHGDQAILG